jgi:hypothetical protein
VKAAAAHPVGNVQFQLANQDSHKIISKVTITFFPKLKLEDLRKFSETSVRLTDAPTKI